MRQARSAKDHAPTKAALTAQLAVAIAILTFAPVRLSNLVRIELGENLIKPGGLREIAMPAASTARIPGKVRSLPLDLWPEADRRAWIAACRPAERLKRGGAAGHLKPITRDDLARRYGYFLDFLDRRGLLQADAPTAAYVTPGNVEAYIAMSYPPQELRRPEDRPQLRRNQRQVVDRARGL
jgi:hypothetical protein